MPNHPSNRMIETTYILTIEFIYRVRQPISSLQAQSYIILDAVYVFGLGEGHLHHLLPRIQIEGLATFVLHKELVDPS